MVAVCNFLKNTQPHRSSWITFRQKVNSGYQPYQKKHYTKQLLFIPVPLKKGSTKNAVAWKIMYSNATQFKKDPTTCVFLTTHLLLKYSKCPQKGHQCTSWPLIANIHNFLLKSTCHNKRYILTSKPGRNQVQQLLRAVFYVTARSLKRKLNIYDTLQKPGKITLFTYLIDLKTSIYFRLYNSLLNLFYFILRIHWRLISIK